MSDAESTASSSTETDQARVEESAYEQTVTATAETESEMPVMNAPPGIVPGNFLATIFLTVHISLNAIVNYLRMIPIPFFRGLMWWLTSIDIVNRLSDGALEEHPRLGRLVGNSPQELRQHIENLATALEEVHEGAPRLVMYNTVMRMIQELVFES